MKASLKLGKPKIEADGVSTSELQMILEFGSPEEIPSLLGQLMQATGYFAKTFAYLL